MRSQVNDDGTTNMMKYRDRNWIVNNGIMVCVRDLQIFLKKILGFFFPFPLFFYALIPFYDSKTIR